MMMMARFPFIHVLTLAVAAALCFLSRDATAFVVPSQPVSLTHSLASSLMRNDFSFRASKSPLLAQTQEEGEGTQISTSLSSFLDKPALAKLDILALVGFAAIGKASHTAADGSIDPFAVVVTAFPFVTAWLATSPITEVYKDLEIDTAASNKIDIAKSALVQTAKGWAVAVPLGCVLRGLIKGYVPPLPFVIVTLVATLVILGAVRVVYAFATLPNNS